MTERQARHPTPDHRETVRRSPEYIGLRTLSNFFGYLSARLAVIANQCNFMRYRMEFGERDDDIYIVTFPKSGTTVMQVILYQLVTNGKGTMDFDHIYDVSPWLRNDAFRGRPVRELPPPRVIKSHDFYESFDRRTKGRFIYVYRNGMDVAVSLYHQNKNYNKPDLSFDVFLRRFIRQRRGWFRHLRDWLENNRGFPVLYVRYEDLVVDKRHEIERIIAFLGLDVSDEAIERALEYSSLEFMKKHETKFGVQPPDIENRIFDQFIRKGATGEGARYLSAEQQSWFLAKERRILGRTLSD